MGLDAALLVLLTKCRVLNWFSSLPCVGALGLSLVVGGEQVDWIP